MLKGFLNYSEDDGADPQGGSSADNTKTTDVLDRFGRDSIKLAEKLAEFMTDNHSLREQRRTLKQQLADLQGKVPAEGVLLLQGDDAAAWEAYKGLGKPSDLQTALAERTDYATKLAAHERRVQLTSAATISGYDPDVLAQLAGDLPITTKTEGTGKDQKQVAYVTADGKEHRLTDYAAQAWQKFMPALAPQSKGDGVGSPAGGAKPKALADNYAFKLPKI